jgi:hypothetical protein
MQPGLILIDAGTTSVPWVRWIHVLKTSAATRRIPILVFGPHVQTDLLERARSAGADAVVTRGSFNNRMAELIKKHCSKDITQDLITACDGELSAKAIQGIKMHNQGEYFEAHEYFEEAWIPCTASIHRRIPAPFSREHSRRTENDVAHPSVA